MEVGRLAGHSHSVFQMVPAIEIVTVDHLNHGTLNHAKLAWKSFTLCGVWCDPSKTERPQPRTVEFTGFCSECDDLVTGAFSRSG